MVATLRAVANTMPRPGSNELPLLLPPPVEPSPYLPVTRRFVSPLYVRVELVPEFAYLTGAVRAEIEQRLDAVRSPFRTAEVFMIEEIVDPRDTRPLLCEFANLAAPVRGAGPTARGTRP